MNSEQKMREALLKVAFTVELAERERDETRKAALFEVAEKHAHEALAAPAGEQVGLTDDEIAEIDMMPSNPEGQDIIDFARAVIAAHEAKRNGGAS